MKSVPGDKLGFNRFPKTKNYLGAGISNTLTEI